MKMDTCLMSTDLNRKLDVVDQVKEDLQRALAVVDKKFFEQLLQEIPQFVTAGPQSSGKSSVIYRVSGVRLPVKATRCTRTAIVLRLRRESYQPITVELKRLEGPSETFTGEDVTTAIELAQSKAIEESGGTEFAENHFVEVHVRHPRVPNITLVDLPGFTNDTERDTQTVQRMVERYLKMPGSLVLQVVKADQDYGAVLGNDFLRPYTDKCTTVFTYCDLLDSHPHANVQAWMEKAIQETRAPRFAVLGSSLDSVEIEEADLTKLTCFQDEYRRAQYQLGTAKLNAHLEQLITNHLNRQLPVSVRHLNEELAKVEQRLNMIKERSKLGVVLEIIQTIQSRWKNSEKERHDGIVKVLDGMRADLQNLRLRTIDSDSNSARHIDEKEVLEPGTSIFVDDKKRCKDHLARGRVTKTGTGWHGVTFDDGTTETYWHKSLYSNENDKSSVVAEILPFVRLQCGLRNVAHADPQLVIDRYAKDFSERYEEVLLKVRGILSDLVQTRLDDYFAFDDLPLVGQQVTRHLKDLAQVLLKDVNGRVDGQIQAMVGYNQSPLTFSPNEHYLDQIFRDLVANDSISGSTDEGSATLIYYKVRAYLKVETKFIVEASAKCFVQQYEVEFGRLVAELLCQENDHLIDLVQEPAGMKEERAILTRRKDALYYTSIFLFADPFESEFVCGIELHVPAQPLKDVIFASVFDGPPGFDEFGL